MKLKEINRTAIQTWSPAQHHPVYLATGTSAQQLDASFSTSASLEFFELDLAEPCLDMKSCGSLSSSHRYHKLVWSSFGMDTQAGLSGVLIAGGENGTVLLYDPAKIIAGESDVIIAESDRHTGPVRALDVNPFQTNLFASGGNESEIYIWDMNNFMSPMTPGPKTQPQEDISYVAWNKQVQHILASASPSGRTSVWDLRKNDLIIKVSDHSNRMHCSGLAWNPEVATQLVLASEDDRMPVIQMWDLRFATSPLKVLEHHTRGVLAIAWSLADPELLLSCGKDSRILCWNPNTAEVLYELPTSSQWCFDIQWCPRNPAVLSAAGFDGHIDIHSIMGGSSQAQTQRHADQISNSFGNMDPFGTGQVLPPLQLPQTAAPPAVVTPLKKPPKWICRPVGASFAFGGKLVSLENLKCQQPTSHLVHISQVVTETALVQRSQQLQATLNSRQFVDFCQEKIDAAENESEKTVWSFLKANFGTDIRSRYLELLGYNKQELALKISAALEGKPANATKLEVSAPASLTPPADPPEAVFDLMAAANLQPSATLELDPTAEPEAEETEDAPDYKLDANINQVLSEELIEKKQEEEEIPLNEEMTAAAEVEDPSPPETPAEIPAPGPTPAGRVSLSISQDVDGLIMQALLTGDFEGAVELCLCDNRMADSIILAIAGGPELLQKTQRKYFTTTHSKITKLISAVVMKDWQDVLNTCDLHNWKEALAAVMTYAQPDEFSSLCELLGDRLEAAEDTQLKSQACLCYICAGNIEKLVSGWSRAQNSHCPQSLQALVEKVVVLRHAVEQTQQSAPAAVGILLAEKMSQYANLLASQGCLSTAITYLPSNTNQVGVQQLYERLSRALGQQAAQAPAHRVQSQLAACQNQHLYSLVPQPTAAAAAGPTAGSAQAQYFQQVRAASTVTSWSNQIPTALPSAPPPPPPPQAGSTSEPKVEAPNLMYPVPASSSAAAAHSSTPAYMLSHQYQRPQNGWNDPPALTRAPKKKMVPENYSPPAPITAPIMAPLPADPQTQPVSSGAPQTVVQGPHMGQVPFSGLQQQLPPTVLNSSVEGAPGAPTGDNIHPLQSIPTEKIMKKPLPEEHLVLKTTFEGLIQKCLVLATDPQTKRKLEEANKRLEVLYDKLREETLSPAIIGGLHNMARAIVCRTYTEGLNIHTHIVSSSNFSETSAFMPVLKVLLTQANKLGV
ncbi:protein transport protein Sec31A isoform X2 [Austrofundulus limnaeus]|uniref:Protein transport protein Sec31A n=1 Tax=Austrofundulus limnaeus TaxID=52670 RepID=A0A2I4CZC8_AUSLI|nr:PREDICTED: protein transport protein Sec31A isoform X2 [Austrofundulus limnaeus]